MGTWPPQNPEHVIGSIIALVIGTIIALLLTPKRKPVLNPKEWQEYTLQKIDKVSSNTGHYRFKLNRPDDILGLPIGQHLSVMAHIDGKDIQRSYTPTSSDDEKGFFELMIKSYPQGNVSKHIGEMEVGDKLKVKGPKGTMHYTPDMCSEIGMVAGGTGITPMLQIIRACCKNAKDTTKISLIYANQTPEDILLRDELDSLAKEHDKFHVHYTVDKAPDGWEYSTGYVTKEMIEEHLPKHSDTSKMLLCGPPPQVSAVAKTLTSMGWPEPRTVSKKEDAVYKF
ncbi:hypothetical protein E5Q_03098 [Mixia osmundae IAM 14324]|uniref:NADH-cytochrome b5 reductase n=1 Tax=Mixia osmundae (strain CBS 9802 / IAM 14324 / JCM 22182 / KY 12970) TaxID=764103 RepID=G7E0S2_MIXOS|nr:hypothetical protein E5Q_03098 [Mixia osmundae IAM 14324]